MPPGAFSVLIQCWGLLWDLSWHLDFGRESLLDPPHVVMGIGIVVALLAWWHERRRTRVPRPHRLGGPALLLFGILWEIAALGWDQLWHVLFGSDLKAGIWSPPHIMVITGVWVQAIWSIVASLSQEADRRSALPIHSLLGCAVLLSVVSPFFGPIEYLLHRRDPFLYPLLMAGLAAFVFLVGRTATQHPHGCTIIAALYTLVRGLPALVLWLAGRAMPGYPTPLIVPALLIDWSLRRTKTPTRRAAFLAGTAFGVLPLLELPLVNLRAAYQWPVEVALFAILPAAAVGMSSGYLGWRVGTWLRRILLIAGPVTDQAVERACRRR